EGHVLMRVRLARLSPHPAKVLPEARLPRQVGTEHEHVHEVTDQSLQLRTRSPRNRHPHRDIFLCTVAIQQHLKGCEQRREQRGLLPPPQLRQSARELLSKLERDSSA